MIARLRTSLAVVLSLLLILLGQTASAARASVLPWQEMVICSGSGVVVIRVDENGDPVGPPHVCPDCMAHLLSAVLPGQADPVAETGTSRRIATPRVGTLLSTTPLQAAARDPPLPL